MLDIYISHKAFLDCIVNKSDSFIQGIFSCKEKGFVLYVADEQLKESVFQDTSSPEYITCQAYDFRVLPGVETAELVKMNCKDKNEIKGGLSTAIFILGGITPEEAKKISERLGLMCFSDAQIPPAPSFKSITKTLEAGENYEWKQLINNFRSIPVNSIIINDKYLHKNPNKAIYNLQRIVSFLIPSRISRTINILLLSSEDNVYSNRPNEEYRNKVTILTGLRAYLKDTMKIDNPCIEMLLYKKDSDLYKSAHNRFIITNYGIISTEQTLSVFTQNGMSDVLQTVTSTIIFSENSTNGFERWIKYLKTISRIIKKDIYSDKNNNYQCYCMSAREVININLNKMKNKLLELKEGDKCYYLSVPNQNGWADIRVIKGEYHQGPYANCIYSSSQEALNEKAKKIQALFRDMKTERYKQSPDDAKEYYRISISDNSNFGELIVIRDTTLSSGNQKQYLNNHFLELDDAISIAETIRRILGGGIPIRKPE